MLLEALRALLTTGRRMPMSSAMMPMTTRSSTSVKPRDLVVFIQILQSASLGSRLGGRIAVAPAVAIFRTLFQDRFVFLPLLVAENLFGFLDGILEDFAAL